LDTSVKQIFDDFTNVYAVASTTSQPRTVYNVQGTGTYENMVDMLKTSWGNVRLHLVTRIYRTTSTGAAGAGKYGLFLSRKQWDLGYMAKPANTNLAADGSGPKGFIDAFATMRCLNPLGQMAIAAS
jgi:hypothetical protein